MSPFTGNAQARAQWDAAILPTYPTPPLALVRGQGARVWDADGREYLDLVAGIAVNALGHSHPAVVAAVEAQIRTLDHVSNLFVSEPSVRLAERLLALAGRDGKVFFCNSGAEANEAAIKLARLTGRSGLVAAEGGFHGRTTGALALTGQPAKAAPFQPLLPGVRHVPYGDAEALRAAVEAGHGAVGAVVLEPIQGEAGVRPAPPGYLAAARQIATDQGALLVLDEVQTGVGRTGAWFAGAAEGVAADVVTLAKGLGGGLPLGACLAFDTAAELFQPGQHASTFGGNPVACAAGLAVLDVIESEGLLARVTALGGYLVEQVLRLGSPLVAGVRGRGLLQGIVLTAPLAADVVTGLRAAGVLVNAAAPDVVRLVPPLVVTEAELDRFVEAFGSVLAGLGEPVPAQDGARA